MIHWFVPALMAAILWAGVNVADDHLLRSVYREPAVATGTAGCAALLPAGIVFAGHGRISLDGTVISLALLAGAGVTVYVYLLFFAFARHEPSVVIALGGLGQIALPIVASIAISERLSPSQYIGIVIIAVVTSCLAMLDRQASGVSARLVLLSSVGAALFVGASIALKHVYELDTFSDVFPWYGVGSAICGGGFLVGGGVGRLAPTLAALRTRLVALIAVIEAVNGLADYLQGWAISRGPVSAVRAVEGSQPLFVLAFGVILARLGGRASREHRTDVWSKTILFGVLIAGVVLVA